MEEKYSRTLDSAITRMGYLRAGLRNRYPSYHTGHRAAGLCRGYFLLAAHAAGVSSEPPSQTEEWENIFRRWYPVFRPASANQKSGLAPRVSSSPTQSPGSATSRGSK
jgi:hypothetical protein